MENSGNDLVVSRIMFDGHRFSIAKQLAERISAFLASNTIGDYLSEKVMIDIPLFSNSFSSPPFCKMEVCCGSRLTC